MSTSLTIVGSTISGNSAGTAGGIYHGEGSLTITDSTVTNNTGTSQAGGIATRGQMTISGSTISNNNGGSQGGGLLELSGTGTIVNSTFSGNTTTGAGGAIAAFSSDPTTIRNTTIAGNTSVYNGTVFNLSTSTWAGVILANNTGANCFSSPAVISQGYNISDDGTCGLTAATDKENVSEGAGLDPKGLQNNGGPTQTIALLPASPAVNVIPAANCTLATDQRGTSRPQGAGCDAGAYELVLTVPFSSFNANLVISTGKIPGFALTDGSRWPAAVPRSSYKHRR